MVEQGAKAADTRQLVQKQEAVQEHFSQDTLKENLGKLSRFGGFSFLESAIDRVQNLNPDRKARMSIYLKDEDKKEDRRNLLRTLDLWINMLEENSTIDEMLSACNAEVNEVSICLPPISWLLPKQSRNWNVLTERLNRSMTTPDRIRLPISQ